MLNLILLIVAICLVTLGLVYLIDRYLPFKMKPIIILVFSIISIYLAYMIYQSINAPIEFNKVRKERYTKVIDKLKDIRNSQEAYRTVNGDVADDFESMIRVIDTAQSTIRQEER